MDSEDTQEESLLLLEKQGQQFLAQFSQFKPKKHTTVKSKLKKSQTLENDVDEEEWLGFSDIYDGTSRVAENKGKALQLFLDVSIMLILNAEPEVVVFNHAISGVTPVQHKELFMSSKISKLKDTRPEDRLVAQGDEELEQSNIRNDALLHRLIHTELLSGSLKNELMPSSAAQKRKALAGRVLELSGDVKLGKGEVSIRQEERQHASKSVREGMLMKEKRRRAKALNEAKETGNYHPSLRKLFSEDKNIARRKRERGLSMGVGHFTGGILKLSKHEIQSMQDGKSAQSSKWKRNSKGKS